MEQPNKPIAEYSKTEAELSKLKEKCATTVYDIKTPQGMKTAVSLRAEIRTNRTGIEAVRKEIKAPVIELGKRIDSEAQRLTNELVALETPIDTVIKAEEKRKTEAKQAEKDRKTKVNAFFDEMKQVVIDCIGKDSCFIKTKHDYVASLVISESFFLSQFNDACAAKGEALTILGDMCLDAEKLEIEAKEALEKAEKIKTAILAKMKVFSISLDERMTLEAIAKKRQLIESVVVDAMFGELEQKAHEEKRDCLEYLGKFELEVTERLEREAKQAQQEKAEKEPEVEKPEYAVSFDLASDDGDKSEVFAVDDFTKQHGTITIQRSEYERLLWLTTPKPIDTAPRDGSVIDLWYGERRFPNAFWLNNTWEITIWDGTNRVVSIENPTHWQPLPSHVMPMQQTKKPLDNKPDPMGPLT